MARVFAAGRRNDKQPVEAGPSVYVLRDAEEHQHDNKHDRHAHQPQEDRHLAILFDTVLALNALIRKRFPQGHHNARTAF